MLILSGSIPFRLLYLPHLLSFLLRVGPIDHIGDLIRHFSHYGHRRASNAIDPSTDPIADIALEKLDELILEFPTS